VFVNDTWEEMRNSLNSSSQHTTNIQMESVRNGSDSNKARKVDLLFQLLSTRFGILGASVFHVLVRLRLRVTLRFARTPGFFLWLIFFLLPPLFSRVVPLGSETELGKDVDLSQLIKLRLRCIDTRARRRCLWPSVEFSCGVHFIVITDGFLGWDRLKVLGVFEYL